MGGIKYYRLAKGEELPDEFCVVRDIGGEPSEYTFYEPESENAKLKADVERMFQANVEKNNEILGLLRDNAKLRELVRHLYTCINNIDIDGNYECFLCEYENTDGLCDYERLMRELGIEVE